MCVFVLFEQKQAVVFTTRIKESENAVGSTDSDKIFLNDSIVSNASDLPTTPGSCKMTPKQLQRRLESKKKKHEKERAKLEHERKIQEEIEALQHEKKERDIQKKGERGENGNL